MFRRDSMSSTSNNHNVISQPKRSQGLLYKHTVRNGASSHKTTYIDIFSEILNLEGHLNCCISSKVTAIFLNGWILPAGGVASGGIYNILVCIYCKGEAPESLDSSDKHWKPWGLSLSRWDMSFFVDLDDRRWEGSYFLQFLFYPGQRRKKVWACKQCLCKFFVSSGKIRANDYAVLLLCNVLLMTFKLVNCSLLFLKVENLLFIT